MVPRIDALRDDPFPPRAARTPEHRGASRARVAQRERGIARAGGREQGLEPVAPVGPRT